MRTVFYALLIAAFFAVHPGYAFGDAPSLREKIGQMVMVGFLGDDTQHSWFKDVLKQVRSGQIGGVLYLHRNVRDKETVIQMNAALQTAARDHSNLLIAVDQEGGKVQRLRRWMGFPTVPAAKHVADHMDLEKAFSQYDVLAQNLNLWGFNLNLAPVVDVDVNASNPIVGKLGRSFSKDPAIVAKYASAFVDAHRKNGVLTALKHFPGHGSSKQDSHFTIAEITDSWSKDELIPFRDLISEKRADIIMTAHVRHRKIQSEKEPKLASLSKSVVTGLLRDELKFSGVVISDDLQMGSVRGLHDIEEAALLAIRAGTDILIFANDKNPDLKIPEKVAEFVSLKAQNDTELVRLIDESYRRIIELKQKLANEKDLETVLEGIE